MTKLILGPILGGLSDTQAYIWGRTDGLGTLYAWVGRRPDLADVSQPTAQSQPLVEQNGFTGVVPLNHLQPGTDYYYTVTFDQTLQSPLVWPYPRFHTFPPARETDSFSFAFGSCFLPADEHGGAIFEQINTLRNQRKDQPDKALRFLLLIGDQIYADAYNYNGLGRCALSLEEYRQVYAYTWSRPAFRKLYQKIPVFMMMDDHEVDDDWTWTDADRNEASIPIWDRLIRWRYGRPKPERTLTATRIKAALEAYWEHQGMHARGYLTHLALDEAQRYTLAADDPGSFAYRFTYGGAAFFVMDTRTMRVKPQKGQDILLGEDQWRALIDWLDEVKDEYPIKFIITSCAMLYQLRLDITKDRWAGFPDERRKFIEALSHRDIQGVILLAGDLHSGHAMQVGIPGGSGEIPLWEFCATPFEQKPTWMTKYSWMRKPLSTDLVTSQRLHFTYPDLNFGIVSVNFEDPKRPEVCFDLYGLDGQVKGSVNTGSGLQNIT